MQIASRKVAIIGVGYVGASIAYALSIRSIAREIVLIDTNHEKAQGEALDIQHGIAEMGSASIIAGDYADCKDADLIIITAGRNRRNGETRLDLIDSNVHILRDVIDHLKPNYTKGVIVIVANPVDILTALCSKWMELPNGMVFGTGCILDTSRIIRLIANYTRLNAGVVKANVVGEHGDAQIPIWSHVSIAGVPIGEYCESVDLPWSESIADDIAAQVKGMGASIIKAKGRTHYGIATCVCYLADAVLNQRLTIVPVTSVFQGEYGIRDVSLSVPSIVGVNGVERRLEEKWTNDELSRFRGAATKLQDVLKTIHAD